MSRMPKDFERKIAANQMAQAGLGFTDSGITTFPVTKERFNIPWRDTKNSFETAELCWDATVLACYGPSPSSRIGATFVMLACATSSPTIALRNFQSKLAVEFSRVPLLPRARDGAFIPPDSEKEQPSQLTLAYMGVLAKWGDNIAGLPAMDQGFVNSTVRALMMQMYMCLNKSKSSGKDDTLETAASKIQELIKRKVEWKDVTPGNALNKAALALLIETLGKSTLIKRAMVMLLKDYKSRDASELGEIATAICKAGTFCANAALTPYITVFEHVVSSDLEHAWEMSMLRRDILKYMSLLDLYLSLGGDAPYCGLIGDAVALKFSPINYAALFAYSYGLATALDKKMEGYQIDPTRFDTGLIKAGKQRGIRMREEHGIDAAEEAKLDFSALLKATSGDEK